MLCKLEERAQFDGDAEENPAANKFLSGNIQETEKEVFLSVARFTYSALENKIVKFSLNNLDIASDRKEVVEYLLENCDFIKKEEDSPNSTKTYQFISKEFQAYMHANVDLDAAKKLAEKVNTRISSNPDMDELMEKIIRGTGNDKK